MNNSGIARQDASGADLRNVIGRAKMPEPVHSPQKETTTMTLRSTTSSAPMLLAHPSHPEIEVTR